MSLCILPCMESAILREYTMTVSSAVNSNGLSRWDFLFFFIHYFLFTTFHFIILQPILYERSVNFKMSYWCLQFSPKMNKNNLTWGIIPVKLIFFFFGFVSWEKIPKRHCEIRNLLCQTKNLFTFCASHKHFVPDKKMICIQ